MKLNNLPHELWNEIKGNFIGIIIGGVAGYISYRLADYNNNLTLSLVDLPQSIIEQTTGIQTNKIELVFIFVGMISGYIIWKYKSKLPEPIRRLLH